ncbi:MAG: GTP 3',8-cyclase MoaA [Verrucomicrobiota bacterium]
MEDPHGHKISYLRVSITDRCNERCHYCLPEESQQWLERKEILSYEEILRTIRVAASLGVSKIRVTGGEPLTRRGVLSFLSEIKAIPGIEQLGISTNGSLLTRQAYPDSPATNAQALQKCGVDSVNISLDTLDRETYAKTTGRDYLPQVIDGIRACKSSGIASIKINSVLMRGRNEHEVWDLIEFARAEGVLLRFIELMPVSTSEVLTEHNFLSVGEAKKLVEFRLGALTSLPEFRTNGPAKYFQVPETDQKIGFIGAMTAEHFCSTCNKLRLTCDGKLRPCLGSHLEFDLKNTLRASDKNDDDIRSSFLNVVENKPESHEFLNNYQPGRKMIAIGG